MKISIATLLLSGGALLSSTINAQQGSEFKGTVGKTLAESKEYWPAPVKPAAGAPNIVWILLDDVGFGASSAFGGVISTPVFDSLANSGLRYTNFHTAGICAPTRASLLTGRNHHSVHMGGFAHNWGSAGFPGYDGYIPANKATIAEILKQEGYNTFGVGKYGVTPDAEASDAGPFDHWPSGKGFEHFFGFLGSETDQYQPDLVEDNAFVKPDGRHFSEQITDKAIGYIARQQKAAPDKPFFLYYAPAATHAPHQVAAEWSDKYKGQFDAGWDVFRQQVIDNQKKLGIIPANTQLPARNPLVKEWATLSAGQKKLYVRFMEVYAGYLTYTDYQVGRVINYLKEIKELDNTLIFIVIGDNGGSKEGSDDGVIEKRKNPRYDKQITPEAYLKFNEEEIDKIGTPEGQANYPLGWAQATNTPFKYWKQDAQSEGGTRNPLIIFYPNGIKERGLRTQYGHVSDLLPTTLDIAGIKLPEKIGAIKQEPLEGTSLAYSLKDANAPSKHTEQHYYIFGSRSIYKDGWKAGAAHHPDNIDLAAFGNSNKPAPVRDYAKDTWELYNLNEDYNEQVDLANKYPEKLAELKALFDEHAKKYNIYPFIDWEDVYKQRLGRSTQSTFFKPAPPATKK